MKLIRSRNRTNNRISQWNRHSVSFSLLLLMLPFSSVNCTPLDDYVYKPDFNYRRDARHPLPARILILDDDAHVLLELENWGGFFGIGFVRWHDTGERLKGRFITGSWDGVVINMTSQAWLSEEDVDRSVWTHHLVIVVSLEDRFSLPEAQFDWNCETFQERVYAVFP